MSKKATGQSAKFKRQSLMVSVASDLPRSLGGGIETVKFKYVKKRQNALGLAKAGIVSTDNPDAPYWQQGNGELYTSEQLRLRGVLRQNHNILKAISRYWHMAVEHRKFKKAITKKEYMLVFRKVGLSVGGAVSDALHGSATEAEVGSFMGKRTLPPATKVGPLLPGGGRVGQGL